MWQVAVVVLAILVGGSGLLVWLYRSAWEIGQMVEGGPTLQEQLSAINTAIIIEGIALRLEHPVMGYVDPITNDLTTWLFHDPERKQVAARWYGLSPAEVGALYAELLRQKSQLTGEGQSATMAETQSDT